MTSRKNNSRGAARLRGFTLLEVMLVIALIAIVFVGMTPLMTASIRERKLRAAADGIVDLVRSQRSQAQKEGRRHVLEVRPKGFFERGREKPVLGLDKTSECYVRYPGAKWETPAGQAWEFSAIGMVTPLSVRLENSGSWIEVDFDMLTGRVAEQRYAF